MSILKNTEKKSKSLLQIIWSWLFFLILLLAVIIGMVSVLGRQRTVSGSSMYPALADGDHILVDTFTYRFFDPARFDVVIFPFQYQTDVNYIKRIIALPGETIQILDGKILINGRELKENYGFTPTDQPGLASAPITLGNDEYFVMGDNRSETSDSREPSIGNLKRSQIFGKVLLRIWPMDRIGVVR